MENSLLYWSDNAAIYRSVCYGLLALLALLTVWPIVFRKSGSLSRITFMGFLSAFVILARWPGLFHPNSFNPDEDQLVAAARALALDPVFFRSAEAGSSGPLNIYPLLLSMVFGESPTLFTARLVGLLMICLSLGGVFYSCRSVLSESLSRLGVLWLGVFFGLANFGDFVHYTSEHMPMLLLTWGWAFSIWAVFCSHIDMRKRVIYAACAAVLFSMVPFAKLQASWSALGSSVLLVLGVATRGRTLGQRFLGTGLVCAAGAVFPVLAIGFFVWNDVFDYFWKSNILNALEYKSSGISGKSGFQILGQLLFFNPPEAIPKDFLWFVGGWLLVSTTGVVTLVWMRSRKASGIAWFFLLYTIIVCWLAFYTVVAPQRAFPHYLLFLPIPMVMVTMAFLSLVEKKMTAIQGPWHVLDISLIMLLTLGPVVGWRISSPNNLAGQATAWAAFKPSMVSQIILDATQGKGRLCVWGYKPYYYTETGMVQATRLSTSSALFNDNALKPFYTSTYFQDLQRNRPAVFLDSVTPGGFPLMTNRDEHGYHLVPEIREFVETNYELLEEVEGARIYILRGTPIQPVKRSGPGQSKKPDFSQELTKRLWKSLSSKDIEASEGYIQFGESGIRIHPRDTPTVATFQVAGKFPDVQLNSFIDILPDQILADPKAGLAGVEVFLDGKSLGRHFVDCALNHSQTLDLSKARELKVVVDSANRTVAYDWVTIGLQDSKDIQP